MNSSAVTIRPAVESDEPAIVSLVTAAYGPYVARMGGVAPAPMSDDYVELIARQFVSVASVDDHVAGVIVMWPLTDHLYVDNIAVDPTRKGRGVGQLLLSHANETARAHELGEIRLYTNEAMTENLGYYERRGFTETDRRIEHGYHRVYFTQRVPDR